jgi:type IV secretion system protein VirB2
MHAGAARSAAGRRARGRSAKPLIAEAQAHPRAEGARPAVVAARRRIRRIRLNFSPGAYARIINGDARGSVDGRARLRFRIVHGVVDMRGKFASNAAICARIGAALVVMAPAVAHAQAYRPAGPTGSGPILAAVQWLEGTLLGNVATTVAVIAVAFVGFMMLTGRINWRHGVTVILGCFILFGAAAIVSGIQAAAGAAG